jgi:hypothetical protein
MGLHQTTIRFHAEHWRALCERAAQEGVSTAQFIRDAALSRLAYREGQRSVVVRQLSGASAPRPAAQPSASLTGRLGDRSSPRAQVGGRLPGR